MKDLLDIATDAAADARDWAEAAKFDAETEHFRAQTLVTQLRQEKDQLGFRDYKNSRNFERASDLRNRVFRFDDVVTPHSCGEAYEFLSRWARLDIAKPVEIQLTTPGGDAWSGMALVDQILALRKRGLHITITVRGTAASMGAILLQAADERVMGPSSTLLIHKISTQAKGSLDQIEDLTAWIKIMQSQAERLFAERSALTLRQIQLGMNRKDWSLSPEEALEKGFIDRIG